MSFTTTEVLIILFFSFPLFIVGIRALFVYLVPKNIRQKLVQAYIIFILIYFPFFGWYVGDFFGSGVAGFISGLSVAIWLSWVIKEKSQE